jgi:hypothetical protein
VKSTAGEAHCRLHRREELRRTTAIEAAGRRVEPRV